MIQRFNTVLIIFLLMFLFSQLGFAQALGRISGYLRAGNTGEPLIFANIILEGTIKGAASNVHGYYLICNIPAGS
ncbi:MAG: hypothetical protein HQ528_00510, partial [Candidatus Marinimicrobia bacterium]|nr:hypothetical protein [Candidatus Neomarinimicrobiota bacterium]